MVMTDRVVEAGNRYASALTGMEKVVDRLRKILQLTNSPNEAEAASAAAKLQELLTEHNLSMADLEAKGAKAPGVREQAHDLGKAAFKWKLDLADGIAAHYYCASLVDRTRKTVAFVGRPENVESLQMLYGWVIEQIKSIATVERRAHFDRTGEHIDPLRWQVAFGVGAVERLLVRLAELKARQAERDEYTRDATGDITSLVLHHQAEVSDYLEEKFGFRTDGKLTKRERESEERWNAYMAERDAARAAKDDMRIRCEETGDMAPYWAAYPEEHPARVALREKEQAKWRKEEAARERRNARRRTGSWREGPRVDYEKEEQHSTARRAGRAAADRVNLQPFIGGATDRKKVG